MVKLYCITHGYTEVGIFGGSQTYPVKPSDGMQRSLISLSDKTKVGVEALSTEYKREIEHDLIRRFQTAKLPGDIPYYPDCEYWLSIIELCSGLGHEIVFLEDKETLFKYNEAVIKLQKQKLRKTRLSRNKREDSLDFFRRELEVIKAIYREMVNARQIHEVERDDKLLDATRNLDVAIVGKGHSDYWVLNRDKLNIDIDGYTTDVPIKRDGNNVHMKFTQDATPDPRQAYDRESIARSIRLLEKGRVTTRDDPQYVGIWSTLNPFEGYFEMFVEESSGNKVSGTIEDCIGSATFEGIRTNKEFNFVKRYSNSTTQALQGDIYYIARKVGEGFSGYFGLLPARIGSAPFFMKESAKENPIELTVEYQRILSQSFG